ncbi:MAG: hypothetical protein WBQ76_13905 [Candidatus Korobacteraceae bacterium]
MYSIFGLIDPRTKRVFHVGCAKDPAKQLDCLPRPAADKVAELNPEGPQIVILQTAESKLLSTWVKWSKRFRRDLVTKDWEQYRALSDAFTNSNRLKRALGQEVPSESAYHEKFHEFDRRNPEVFAEILRTARRLKTEGREAFGMDAIINEIRWDGPDTNHTDRFKINDSHRAFYARKLQMVDHTLCGLFAMRESFADDLVLDDGQSWRDFVNEHSGELRFAEPSETDEEDTEWTY